MVPMHIPHFTVRDVHVIVMNDKRVSGALPLYPPSGNDTGLCRGLPVQSVRGWTGVRSLVQSQKLAGTPSPGLRSLLCARTQGRTRLLQGSQACQEEVHRECPRAMNTIVNLALTINTILVPCTILYYFMAYITV